MRKNYVLILVLSIIMLVAIIYGISESGSPFETRSRRFDEQRVTDIGNIRYAIENYYSKNYYLPASLKDLPESAYSSAKTPTDPETKQDYAYKTTGIGSYQLCATFSYPTKQDNNPYTTSPSSYNTPDFTHPAGYYCFDITIPDYILNPNKGYYESTPSSRLIPPPATIELKPNSIY